MLRKNVSKTLKKGTFVALLSTFTFLASFSIDSQATSTYYIRTLFDEGTFGMVTQIIPDKGEGKEPAERAKGVDFSSIADYRKVYKGGGDNKTPGSSLIANIVLNDPTKVDETYEKVKTGGDLNMGLVFSFPGITQSVDVGEKTTYTALSSDMARAELVGNTLTKGINDALAFIKTYSGAEHISGEGLRHIVAQLSRITAQFGNDGGSGTFNTGKSNGGKGFSVIQVTGPNQKINGVKESVGNELIPVNGLRYSDYVAISTTNEYGQIVYGYYPWRMAKGYHSDQILAPLVGDEYTKLAKSKENRYITWGQMAIQAGVNADLRGSNISDSASDSMTLIGQGLGADFSSAIASIRSMLNLAPIQELVLNMGSRASTHYMGALTVDMFDTAKVVYSLVLVVSMLFLSITVIKAIQDKILSTTNIVAKVSFMEKLQDLVLVGVMLAVFPSIFELMLEMNYWIVKTFSFSSSYLQAYGIAGNKVLATESLAGAMISSMFLGVDTYINMTYLVRSITLAFLFAISPLVTVLYPNGPTQKKMFFAFLREVAGTIFMQSFHAIVMCFFAGYNTTNMSAMEALVSTYCFIPLTQLFKQFIIGYTGFAESVGGKLAGQLTNTASGMHKSGVMMKQTKEMMDLEASNAKALAGANFKSQMLAMGTDIASSTLHNSIASKEIGSNAMTGAMKGASKSGGSSGMSSPSVGSNLKGAGISLGLGALSAGAGAMAVGNTQKDNMSNLGKMQMEHSMQNIGMGLAETGIGLGISSYDSGVGNSMIGNGLRDVQSGASQYGQGQSNDGVGGRDLGIAKGTDAFNYMAGRTLSTTASNTIRNHNRIREEQGRLADMKYLQDLKNDSRGISREQALEAMGVKNISENTNPVIDVKPHSNNTNNVTFTADVSKLKNIEGNNPHFNYLKELQAKGENHPDTIKAKDLAVKQGFESSFGGNGTGVNGDINSIKDGATISFVVKNMSQYGVEFNDSGEAFAVTDSTKKQINS